MDAAQARTRVIELMDMVEITDAPRRLSQYPHHLSGGMRQRVMLALALSCSPKVIIADEPTTALDVTIQAQILELMKNLTDEFGMALIIITHKPRHRRPLCGHWSTSCMRGGWSRAAPPRRSIYQPEPSVHPWVDEVSAPPGLSAHGEAGTDRGAAP